MTDRLRAIAASRRMLRSAFEVDASKFNVRAGKTLKTPGFYGVLFTHKADERVSFFFSVIVRKSGVVETLDYNIDGPTFKAYSKAIKSEVSLMKTETSSSSQSR